MPSDNRTPTRLLTVLPMSMSAPRDNPNTVALIDEADISLMIDGRGRWIVNGSLRTLTGLRLYVIRSEVNGTMLIWLSHTGARGW